MYALAIETQLTNCTVEYYYCLHGLANCFVDFAFDIRSESPLIIVIHHHHVLVQSNCIIGLFESTKSTFVLAKSFVNFAFDISQSPTVPSQLGHWPLLKSTKATFPFPGWIQCCTSVMHTSIEFYAKLNATISVKCPLHWSNKVQ